MKISSPPAQKRIGVGALARALGREPRALLIDVRSPAEFNTAHIQQARLHPLPDLRPADLLKDLPAGEAIYVICQSGVRAMKAIARFEDAGFQQCVLVEGGMDAWLQAKLPTVRVDGGGLSILRQVQLTVGLISAAGALLAITVDWHFAILPLLMGCGLIFAGLTGKCGLALLLAAMPWNRARGCGSDVCCP